MAGFAGIVGLKECHQSGTSDFKRMVQCLVHGRHQTSETLEEGTVGIRVGWIRDNECPGAFQAWNAGRDICLIFLGEEFGTAPSSNGDRRTGTEQVMRQIDAYENKGLKFIEELNGWFSGLLVDLREEKLVLFNDRYGLSRVYYHAASDQFFFASEAKALLKILSPLRQIDQQGLAEFISVGCVLQNRSLFKDVSLLPGGSVWTFHRSGRIQKQRYFDSTTWQAQEKLDPATYTNRLTEVFSRVAPRYLRSEQAVGMSLTGGLDSRMILACAQAPPGSLPCYTFGGPYRDCADVRIARKLAEMFGQTHTTIRIEDDFFRDFPDLAEKTVLYSDGAMDVSGAVELYVNRRAAEIAPVRVTGNYGSEILRSNVAFGPRRLDLSLFTPEFSDLLMGAAETFRTEFAGNTLAFIAFKQVPWYHYARLAVEKSQLTLRSPFLDNELVALAFQAPPELTTSPEPLLQLITGRTPALGRLRTDRSLSTQSLPIVGTLSRIWREFTAKAEYAYDYGMPSWLVNTDRLFARLHLERLFLGHHKFYHFRIWYRDQLSAYLRGTLRARSRPECYRKGAVDLLVSHHLSGRRNWTTEIHKLLTVSILEQAIASA